MVGSEHGHGCARPGGSKVALQLGTSRTAALGGARDRVGCRLDDLGNVGFGEPHVAAEAHERNLPSLHLLAEPFMAHAEALRSLVRRQQAGTSMTRVDCVAGVRPVINVVARAAGAVHEVAGHRVAHLSASRASVATAARAWSWTAVRTCRARPCASIPSTIRASVSPAAVANRCAAASPGTLAA